jgi:hypothetical protein
MIVKDSSNAQVLMLVASNDAVKIDLLQRDLLASRIRYDFTVLLDRARLTDATADQISALGASMPVIFVIDYRFVGTDCDVLLRTARSVPNAASIACVVINPPLESASRQGLMAGGARLFDEDDAVTSEHLTLQ